MKLANILINLPNPQFNGTPWPSLLVLILLATNTKLELY